MTAITAQVSLYPLGRVHLGPPIERALAIFREAGLDVVPGAMSTIVSGDDAEVFAALQQAFAAATEGEQPVVMVGNGLQRLPRAGAAPACVSYAHSRSLTSRPPPTTPGTTPPRDRRSSGRS